MKAVAYSIQPFEKEFLAKANSKKHDITLISNALSIETAIYARDKEAVVVFTNDDVSEKVIQMLAGFGIKYIATRSASAHHIDKAAAAKYGIKIANVPNYLPSAQTGATASQPLLSSEQLQQIADQIIRNLDLWQQNKCTGKACVCAKNCKNNGLTGI